MNITVEVEQDHEDQQSQVTPFKSKHDSAAHGKEGDQIQLSKKTEEKELLKEEDLLEQFKKLKHEEEQAGLDPLNEEKGRNAIRSV